MNTSYSLKFLITLVLLVYVSVADEPLDSKLERCKPNWFLDDWPAISSSQCFHEDKTQNVPHPKTNLLISLWRICGTAASSVFYTCYDIVYATILYCAATFHYIYKTVESFHSSIMLKPVFITAVSLLKKLHVLILPTANGLAVLLFSWIIMYFDSKIPGVYPPSPISPKKHRIVSGHTFHLGYMVGLLNGLIAFGLTLYQQIPQ